MTYITQIQHISQEGEGEEEKGKEGKVMES